MTNLTRVEVVTNGTRKDRKFGDECTVEESGRYNQTRV